GVEVGPARNFPKLIRKASKLAMNLGLKPAHQDARVVCYSYPKVGLVFLTAEETEVVIDLIDRSLHQQKPDARPESFVAAMTSSSPIDSNAPAGSCAPPAARLETAGSGALAALLNEAGVTGYTLEEFRLPGFVAVAQETGSWCAAAVGCMILEYFGVSSMRQK